MFYIRVFLVTLFFPVALQAQHKFGLELVKPDKPFTMKWGEKQKIKFKAITSAGDFHYAVILKSAGSRDDENLGGPLIPGIMPLRQGANELGWDGKSFISPDKEKQTLVQLKKEGVGSFFFKILIFDTKDVKLHGKASRAHAQALTHLRTKNFKILL